MKSRNYYRNVGIFTLVSAGVLVTLLIILSSGSLFAPRVQCETYIVGSAKGLQVGSPVMFHGVPVGQITRFGFPNITYGAADQIFSRKPYDEWVTVYFVVESKAFSSAGDLQRVLEDGPKQGLRAQPSMAGITGGAYIELTIVPDGHAKPPEFPWTPQYTYIPSAPSTMDKLIASLEKVSENLAKTDFAGTVKRVDQFFANADSLVKNDLAPMMVSARSLVDNMNDVVAQNRTDIFLLIQQMRDLAGNLEQVSERAKTDMSGLIFGAPPPRLPPSNPGGTSK